LNETKKYRYLIFGFFFIVFILSFIIGINIGRRRSDTKIAETQLIVDNLTATVRGLNETIRLTGIENGRLTAIYEQDKETIRELESTNKEFEITNKEIARLLGEQKRIVRELTGRNREIRDSSDTITNGLGRAIGEIEGIIADIQTRKD